MPLYQVRHYDREIQEERIWDLGAQPTVDAAVEVFNNVVAHEVRMVFVCDEGRDYRSDFVIFMWKDGKWVSGPYLYEIFVGCVEIAGRAGLN